MFRKTLALLIRALRVDARSIRPHLMRLGLLLTILWLLFLSHEASSYRDAPGLTLFTSLTYTNIWFITIVGVTYFSSAITEEKEERTLGLLRMADIGAASILLGKWLPRVLGMLSLVAVQFPFTLLSITLGGVTMAQVMAAYVALFLHLIAVGTWSLLGSVLCRNTGAACRLTFIALFLRWMIPTLVESIGTIGSPGSVPGPVMAAAEQLNLMSVYSLTSRALGTSFSDTPFPQQAWFWLAESCLVFLLAWLVFEPCTRGDVMSDVQPSLWSRILHRKKRRTNHRRAWTSAIAGKDFMLLAGGVRGSLLRFIAYAGIIGVVVSIVIFHDNHISASEMGGFLISFGLGFLALDVVQSAAKIFRVELQEQTWSALVMLPRSINSIAWSKIGGCAIGWWPSLSLILLGSLLVPEGVSSVLRSLTDSSAGLFFSYFVIQIVLALELTVFCSIALTWAAWPLAAPLSIFVVFLGNVLLLTCLASAASGVFNGMSEAVFFVLTGVSIGIATVIYRLIGQRLFAKASDGA